MSGTVERHSRKCETMDSVIETVRLKMDTSSGRDNPLVKYTPCSGGMNNKRTEGLRSLLKSPCWTNHPARSLLIHLLLGA